MTIRTMTEKDAAAVAAIERDCFSRPWSEESFSKAAGDVNALFLVAQEQEILGYIGIYLSAPEGEITNVAVASSARGLGIGHRLVTAMQEAAAARGVTDIFLEVRDSNMAAIRLYAAHGFQEVGIRKGFYNAPKEDARIMTYTMEGHN